jgi:hypothetical protein
MRISREQFDRQSLTFPVHVEEETVRLDPQKMITGKAYSFQWGGALISAIKRSNGKIAFYNVYGKKIY